MPGGMLVVHRLERRKGLPSLRPLSCVAEEPFALMSRPVWIGTKLLLGVNARNILVCGFQGGVLTKLLRVEGINRGDNINDSVLVGPQGSEFVAVATGGLILRLSFKLASLA